MQCNEVHGRVLVKVRVEGLLGEFDHLIDFPQDHEFVILHGPNGVGKTRLLELIEAALAGAPPLNAPFANLYLTFQDGAELALVREDRPIAESEGLFAEPVVDSMLTIPTGVLRWRLRISDEVVVDTAVASSDSVQDAVRLLSREGVVRRIPFRGSSRVLDTASGEEIDADEALRRYSEYLSPESLPVPPEITSFLATVSATLIEVNRLRLFRKEERKTPYARPDIEELPAPVKHARDLAGLMTDAQAAYALTSQNSDRSYPMRLLEQGAKSPQSADVVRELADQVESERRQLRKAGLLVGDENSLHDVSNELEAWQRAALALHYRDELQKLESLAQLRDKIVLFLDLVSAKLMRKSMRLDAKRGFYFDARHGELNPDELSSGEQHEVVMMYRLIFETDANQLVMIDEPEISLHVSWQRQFIDDLQRISRQTGARFMIATHSPQVVGSRYDRMVALGDVDE